MKSVSVKIREFINNNLNRIIICILIGLTLIRLSMFSREAMLLLRSPHDDDLMVSMALNIDGGKWLGEYNQFTLLKGVSFPFFLVLIHKIGLPYTFAVGLFYIIACGIFVYSLKPIIKSDILRAFVYIVLMFNPGAASTGGLQRVYLSTIVAPEVLIVFAGIFSMYIYRNEMKKMFRWSILTSLILALMWQTKDDAVWIIPFVLVASIVTIVLIIKRNTTLKNRIISICICIMPLFSILAFNLSISIINYVHYGTFVTREIDEGSFSKLVGTLYSIECDEDIEYVSVSRGKLDVVYSVSPTFASIKNKINKRIDDWNGNDRNPNDREVEDGWFMFMLRDAIADAGYFENAQKMNHFCEKVVSEIDTAIQNNKIKANKSFFGVARISPWKDSYAKKLPKEIFESCFYAVRFDGCMPEYYSPVTMREKQDYERFLYCTANFNDNVYYDLSENDKYYWINVVYTIVSPILFVFSLMIYIVELIYFVWCKFKKKNIDFRMVLLQSAIILSLFVILFGMSYTHITSFSIYSSTYFVAPYVLCLMFECTVISTYLCKNLRKEVVTLH